MGPIVRLERPEGLTPRAMIAKLMGAGMTRADAKGHFDRLNRNEWWGNEVYSVCVDRDSPLHMMGDSVRLVHASFHRRDQGVLMDWREHQAIKDAVFGSEGEAVSVFPATSRLVDTSNEFHLWGLFGRETGEPACFPVGWTTRLVSGSDEAAMCGATQRPTVPA